MSADIGERAPSVATRTLSAEDIPTPTCVTKNVTSRSETALSSVDAGTSTPSPSAVTVNGSRNESDRVSGTRSGGAETMLSALRRGNEARARSSESTSGSEPSRDNTNGNKESPTSTFHFNSTDLKAVCHQFRNDPTLTTLTCNLETSTRSRTTSNGDDDINASESVSIIPDGSSQPTNASATSGDDVASESIGGSRYLHPASSPMLIARSSKLPPPQSPRISQYEPALNPRALCFVCLVPSCSCRCVLCAILAHSIQNKTRMCS